MPKSNTGDMDLSKRHRGDRRDGVYLGKLDPFHLFMPLLYPNRCDNEAYISETIDLSNINTWIEKHNDELESAAKEAGEEDVFKFTLFHLIVTAMLKTITLRPKMNRFVANKKMYQRREITASFVVKKKFSDDGAEGLALIKGQPDDDVHSIHEKIRKKIYSERRGGSNGSIDSMEMVGKLPFPIIRFLAFITRRLDVHGRVPKALIATDPYYSSVVLSNLGSIKLKSGYHHLTNWGTTSIFCIVGEKKPRPFFNEDATYEMRDSIEIGLTIDERLADGYYYSKTIRLLKKLLDNPELLESPLEEEVEY